MWIIRGLRSAGPPAPAAGSLGRVHVSHARTKLPAQTAEIAGQDHWQRVRLRSARRQTLDGGPRPRPHRRAHGPLRSTSASLVEQPRHGLRNRRALRDRGTTARAARLRADALALIEQCLEDQRFATPCERMWICNGLAAAAAAMSGCRRAARRAPCGDAPGIVRQIAVHLTQRCAVRGESDARGQTSDHEDVSARRPPAKTMAARTRGALRGQRDTRRPASTATVDCSPTNAAGRAEGDEQAGRERPHGGGADGECSADAPVSEPTKIDTAIAA